MTDQDLLTDLQYALLEPPNGGASWTAEFWSVQAVSALLNAWQDTILCETGVIITRPGALQTIPQTPRHVLPQSWMATRRMVWRQPPLDEILTSTIAHLITLGIGTPGDIPHFILVGLSPAPLVVRGRYTPLPKARWSEVDHSDQQQASIQTDARPLVYLEPENLPAALEVEVSPAVYDAGVLEPWMLARGATLSNTGVPLTLPDECAPLLKYGVLADLLLVGGRVADPERAAYCASRVAEGVAVMQQLQLVGWR